MRVISAYLLVRFRLCENASDSVSNLAVCSRPDLVSLLQAVLGGNDSPTADDIKTILDSGKAVSVHYTALWSP